MMRKFSQMGLAEQIDHLIQMKVFVDFYSGLILKRLEENPSGFVTSLGDLFREAPPEFLDQVQGKASFKTPLAEIALPKGAKAIPFPEDDVDDLVHRLYLDLVWQGVFMERKDLRVKHVYNTRFTVRRAPTMEDWIAEGNPA